MDQQSNNMLKYELLKLAFVTTATNKISPIHSNKEWVAIYRFTETEAIIPLNDPRTTTTLNRLLTMVI